MACVGAEVWCIQGFGERKSEGRKPLAGPRLRCYKHTSKKWCLEGVDQIDLTQHRDI